MCRLTCVVRCLLFVAVYGFSLLVSCLLCPIDCWWLFVVCCLLVVV